MSRSARLSLDDPRLKLFWRQRHHQSLTTLTPAGMPHTVPVAATLDPAAGLARVLTSRHSKKARNIAAYGGPSPVTLCQVDGRTWVTLEGHAEISDDPLVVADAERRYAERFRTPRVNPHRVILLVTVDRAIGSVSALEG